MLRITSQDCLNGVDREKETPHTFKGVVEYWHYGGQKIDDRVRSGCHFQPHLTNNNAHFAPLKRDCYRNVK